MTLTVPSFILIYALEDHLLITPERYNEWRQHANDQGVIIWNRQGEVRVIENAVLDNALHVFNDYTTMIANELLVDMPATADRLLWSQGRPVSPSERPVKV